MRSTDWAYLAGLIDGEGCIAARTNEKETCYRTTMTVTNTDREVLEWVVNTFGAGGIYSASSHTKTCYRYRLGRMNDLARILNGAIPYMKVKVLQAQLAVELCSRPPFADQYGIYLLLRELKK